MGDMVSLARITCSTTTRCTTGGLIICTVRAGGVTAVVSSLLLAPVDACYVSEDRGT